MMLKIPENFVSGPYLEGVHIIQHIGYTYKNDLQKYLMSHFKQFSRKARKIAFKNVWYDQRVLCNRGISLEVLFSAAHRTFDSVQTWMIDWNDAQQDCANDCHTRSKVVSRLPELPLPRISNSQGFDFGNTRGTRLFFLPDEHVLFF